MSFLSITSPISHKSVRNVVMPITNEGFRDFIAHTTAIGNPTLQKIGLQMGAMAAQAFLPPGVGTAVAQLCNQLSQKVGDKQAQTAAMEAALKGLPADQKDSASKFMSQMGQLMSNPDFQKQLSGMATQSNGSSLQMSSLSMPPANVGRQNG